jgi:hypothetical protein
MGAWIAYRPDEVDNIGRRGRLIRADVGMVVLLSLLGLVALRVLPIREHRKAAEVRGDQVSHSVLLCV